MVRLKLAEVFNFPSVKVCFTENTIITRACRNVSPFLLDKVRNTSITSMPYYNDKREYFNGGLVLYQRDLEISNPNAKAHSKPKWYMRVKIKGRRKGMCSKYDSVMLHAVRFTEGCDCLTSQEIQGHSIEGTGVFVVANSQGYR